VSTGDLFHLVDSGRGDQLRLLERVVNIDSGTDDKEGVNAVGTILAGELEALGLSVATVPQVEVGDHIVARKPGTTGRNVLLVGHLDTVFPRGTAAARPFRIEDGRAYGPGVYDMRGGLVTMLHALRALRAGAPDAWARLGISVVLNSDEEPGSDTSKSLIADEARAADLACILEPARADGEYVCARKGVARYAITVHGVLAHSGNQPQVGASAVAEIAAKIVRLHALTDHESGLTVNVGVVRGGYRVNVVPDLAECEVDVRLPDRASLSRVESALRELAGVSLVERTTTEIAGGLKHAPMERREDAGPAWAALEQAGREVGFQVRCTATGGASDGNTTSQRVATIDGMGPVGDFAHSDLEFIEVASLAERTKVLARLLELWPDARRAG
jgi:glutamate carboxypeptidase